MLFMIYLYKQGFHGSNHRILFVMVWPQITVYSHLCCVGAYTKSFWGRQHTSVYPKIVNFFNVVYIVSVAKCNQEALYCALKS